MNPQRLIIVFLTLSGAAALAAFLISGSAPEPFAQGTPPLAAGLSNAFTEALPADPVPAERNDRNLTDKLARTFAEGLLINNPEGPRTVVKEDVLVAPSPEAYLEQFLSTPGTVTALTIAQAETISRGTAPGSVPVLEEASEEERSAYLRKFTEIFDANLLVPEIQALLEESPSPEIFNSVSGVLAQSAKRLDALKPPKEFLSLHIAARESLVRLDEIISLSPESSDPLKALLSLEENHRAVLAAAERLTAESKKLPKSISALPAGSGFFPTAHAVVVPINDPAHTAVTWGKLGKMLADWAKDYFKEKLKDLVVNRLTRAMVGWVKGEGLSAGQPRFVTNWERFMDDVVNQAGGSIIESVAPELCQSFGPLVRVAVEPIGARGPRFRTSCTLDRVVSNIQDFYDDFENGGWLAYGAAYQERNNYFGSLLAVNEEVMSAISKAKEAKRDETVAAGGYLGSVVCVKWGWKEAPGTTTSSGLPVLPQGNFECLERKTTTPGSTVGSVVNQALLSSMHRIVNADRLTELMNALVDSALYKLFQSKKDAKGDQGLLGVDVSTQSLVSFDNPCEGMSSMFFSGCEEEMRRACELLPPELKSDCLLAGGGGGTGPGPGGTTSSTITMMAPNPGWTGAMTMILGENFTDATVNLTSAEGQVIVLEGGGPFREGTEIWVRMPRDIPVGQYAVRIGDPPSSNIAYLQIRARMQEEKLLVEATPGWNGGLAHNPGDDQWLIASQGISGGSDEIQTWGTFVRRNAAGDYEGSSIFMLNPTGLFQGAPRVAFGPNAGKYLVVWAQEFDAVGATNEIHGRLVSPDGAMGPLLNITQGLSGMGRLVSGQSLTYDSVNKKFVLAWEHRSGGIFSYLRTIDAETGALGPVVRVADNSLIFFQGEPVVAVNEKENEYCVAYTVNRNENISSIALRRVDASTLDVGPEGILTTDALGQPKLAFGSKDERYLAAWTSGKQNLVGAMDATFLGGCDAADKEDPFILEPGWGVMAYNPVSDSFGLTSMAQDNIFNYFLALDSSGRKIPNTEQTVFVDAEHGNYVPNLAPNLKNGTFGVVSSKDYATYRLAPDMGGNSLKTR